VSAAPRSTYLPAIDGLRAFAVGAVLLFHSDHLSGGFLGVDTFFVLSGFLITRQMLHEVDREDRVSLRAFWSRRARRLLPALLLLLGVLVIVANMFGIAAERINIRNDAPWALGFALNWHHIAASADYWTATASPSPLTHLWSLAVEEQFYLLWPLVIVLLVWRRANRERRVLIGSVIGAALSFALMAAVFDPAATTRAYEGTDTRIGALLVGALCATTIVRDANERLLARLGRRVDVLVLIPVVLLAWMWMRVDGRDGWLYRGGFLLHAVLVAVLLLAVSSVDLGNWLQTLLRQRPMRWFGRLSYGLYLWHWPVYIALSPSHITMSRWPLTALRLAVTIVLASLSYYLVERPVRQGLQHRPLPQTAVLSVLGVAVLAAALVVVPVPDARPAPINVAALTTPVAVAASTAVPVTTTPAAVTTTSPITAGSTPSSTAPPDPTTTLPATTTTVPAPLPDVHSVLWLGDSVAFTTSPGIYAAMSAIGITFNDGSFPGVGLLNDTGPAEFENITERIASQHPDLVIMQMSTWDDTYGVDAIYGALGRVRDLTADAGAQLLLLPVPPMRADQDHDGYRNDAAAAQRLAADDPAHVSYLSTTDFWGTSFRYDLDGDKIPERMNEGVHLCPSGSARFAIWLITQLSLRYANLRVADPATWATGDWSNDPRYTRLPGACSALS
jgi:peptidoglycan/LPS O-acetylase OafA/YrhL